MAPWPRRAGWRPHITPHLTVGVTSRSEHEHRCGCRRFHHRRHRRLCNASSEVEGKQGVVRQPAQRRIAMRKVIAAVLLSALSIPSLAADASERKFIDKGMTESEVLLKIGKPDNESEVSGGGAKVVEKVWTYFPH